MVRFVYHNQQFDVLMETATQQKNLVNGDVTAVYIIKYMYRNTIIS